MAHVINKLETRSSDFLNQFVFKRSATEFVCLAENCLRENRTFTRADIAQTHVRTEHYKEPAFKCSCGKEYMRKHDAFRHRDGANGVVYVCQYCDREFTRKNSKDNHETRCDMR